MTMTDDRGAARTPDTRTGDLPADLREITLTAEYVRGILSEGQPLPRWQEVASLANTLRGMVRLLATDVARYIDEDDKPARAAVSESAHWLSMPLGAGLQSAADVTHSLADLALVLVSHHKRVVGQ